MDISNRDQINIQDAKVTVIGFGRSGMGAARLSNHLGAKTFISDSKTNEEMEFQGKILDAESIQIELSGHSDRIFDADLWIISPGVSQDAPIVIEAKSKNIPIVSEIEFASWFTNAVIIGVTGSNGKTTTVNILYEMCKMNNLSPALAGNVGTAFSHAVLNDLVNPPTSRVYVLEISSFQMEQIIHFKPLISVFLNIAPDHLDRYPSIEEYIQAKLNMVKNQNENDHIIFNADDSVLCKKFNGVPSKTHSFSLAGKGDALFTMNATKIYDEEHATLIQLDKLALLGRHNLANALAAATAARLMGVPNSQITQVMSSFVGIPHRLERVLEMNGVTYYNDSKATNVDAVKVALDSFENDIHLILGGKDKGGEFSQLLPHTQNKVKEIVAYGQAGEMISNALGDAVKLECVSSLRDAIEICHLRAVSGDIVLLSPGCASFDQFNNFEERGNTYKSIIAEMVTQ